MPPIDEITMVARIVLAAGLGLLIGLERERHARSAGLRTCLLVAMAGALIMSLSLHLAALYAAAGADSMIRMDPARLASYAIAGMGFLGAGSIIQGHRRARGVTTGAAMWACTVVGLAVGAGLYLPAVAGVVLTLVALGALRNPGRLFRQDQYVTLEVEAVNPPVVNEVRRLLESYQARIIFAGRERCLAADTCTYTFSLEIRSGSVWTDFLAELEDLGGITCYRWQESDVP